MMPHLFDMTVHAEIINRNINREFPAHNREERQVICLTEEGGEFLEAALELNGQIGRFVGAWRRYSGNARRTGTKEDALRELADVIIVAYVCADLLLAGESLTINQVIARKLEEIYSRGWREESTVCTCTDTQVDHCAQRVAFGEPLPPDCVGRLPGRYETVAELNRMANLIEHEADGTDGGFPDGINTATNLLRERASDLIRELSDEQKMPAWNEPQINPFPDLHDEGVHDS